MTGVTASVRRPGGWRSRLPHSKSATVLVDIKPVAGLGFFRGSDFESVNQNRYYVNKTSKQADWP